MDKELETYHSEKSAKEAHDEAARNYRKQQIKGFFSNIFKKRELTPEQIARREKIKAFEAAKNKAYEQNYMKYTLKQEGKRAREDVMKKYNPNKSAMDPLGTLLYGGPAPKAKKQKIKSQIKNDYNSILWNT